MNMFNVFMGKNNITGIESELCFTMSILFAALVYTLIAQTSANCRFSISFEGLYTCQLENVNATSINQTIDLSGAHIEGRSDSDVVSFTVSGTSTLEEIPTMIFRTFENLEEFEAASSSVRRIDLPYCGSRLKKMLIAGNSISVIQNGAFRGCRSIDDLFLMSNNIERIEDNVFDDLLHLRRLVTAMNPLVEIQRNLFRNQYQIEYLRLDMGSISLIHPGLFQCKEYLSYLDLRQNRLESLTTGTFTNMPNLTELQLQTNSIRFIEEGAFANLPLLSFITLNENPIVVIDSKQFGTSLPSLRVIYWSSNEINAIDRQLFDRLPALRDFLGIFNVCFSNDFFNIQSLEDEVFMYLEICFENFDNLYKVKKEVQRKEIPVLN